MEYNSTDQRPCSKNRPFTYEERKIIETLLRKNGLSCGKIAKHIGRSKNGVVSEVRINGGALKYNAKEAEESFNKRMIEKRQKLHDLNKGNKRTFYMKKRIENLEMQLEILCETTKEILKHVKQN